MNKIQVAVSALVVMATIAFFGLEIPVNDANASDPSHGRWRNLTPAETRVIEFKGTEMPFTGKYNDHNVKGTYSCRRCGSALYRSDHKFRSSCGWPAFDDEIPGAVRRVPDKDGRRTEILCAKCGGHLGHVFTGEMLTNKNERHCVNSTSLDFAPSSKKEQDEPAGVATEKAIFAGGCFWGVEYWLQREPGVLATSVGYTGGHVKNPTYRQVCSKSTGHIEALEVVFDPMKTSFEKLARRFFEIHDPTQRNRQGPDVGEQYSSVIFYTSEVQRTTTKSLIAQLVAKGYDVATSLRPATIFWHAEDYHQDYYGNKGSQPYCHAPQKRF